MKSLIGTIFTKNIQRFFKTKLKVTTVTYNFNKEGGGSETEKQIVYMKSQL